MFRSTSSSLSGSSVRSNRHDEWGVWRFIYDPTASVPAVLVEDLNGTPQAFYVREPDGRLIAREAGESLQYYFFDLLGSTILMAPATEGNPTDTLYYTPWGETVTSGSRASTVGTAANPYRYVGSFGYYTHHQDANLADWMQLGVRFYDPELGRFERRDPARTSTESAYGYGNGNPLVRVDPTGRLAVGPATGGLSGLGAIAARMWTCWVQAFESARPFRDAAEAGTLINGHALAHCVATCKIRRCIAGSRAEAELIGGLLEEWQWVFPERGRFGFGTGRWFHNPHRDDAALWGQIGATLELRRCENCDSGCRRALNDHGIRVRGQPQAGRRW